MDARCLLEGTAVLQTSEQGIIRLVPDDSLPRMGPSGAARARDRPCLDASKGRWPPGSRGDSNQQVFPKSHNLSAAGIRVHQRIVVTSEKTTGTQGRYCEPA